MHLHGKSRQEALGGSEGYDALLERYARDVLRGTFNFKWEVVVGKAH